MNDHSQIETLSQAIPTYRYSIKLNAPYCLSKSFGWGNKINVNRQGERVSHTYQIVVTISQFNFFHKSTRKSNIHVQFLIQW